MDLIIVTHDEEDWWWRRGPDNIAEPGSGRPRLSGRCSNGCEAKDDGTSPTQDDAAAALDDEEPLSADERTWAEIRGYRQALGYVLQMAGDPHFAIDTSAMRSMHYMMLAHDLSKSPGQYRTGPIYVHEEKRDLVVYEGPDAGRVPVLMEELAASLRADLDVDPLVRGAMAHLNLVMIHPYRDGNGRMARALQTLTISRQTIVELAFSSIEEWLGHNTGDYYQVLATTGQRSWRPRPGKTSTNSSAPITCPKE